MTRLDGEKLNSLPGGWKNESCPKGNKVAGKEGEGRQERKKEECK